MPRKQVLSVAFDEDTLQQLRDHAKSERCSIGTVVRQMVDRWFESQKIQRKPGFASPPAPSTSLEAPTPSPETSTPSLEASTPDKRTDLFSDKNLGLIDD